jgi:DNA repair protein RadC
MKQKPLMLLDAPTPPAAPVAAPQVARVYSPKEYKVVALRECVERDNFQCDTPENAAEYWRRHVCRSPLFRPEFETFVVLLVNTRRRVKGHVVIANGTHDTLLVHPVCVFRPAVVTLSAGVILMHNHPSGDPTPSEADIKVTRELIRAGLLLKCEVLDHVVMGGKTEQSPKDYTSLRELGYFYQ